MVRGCNLRLVCWTVVVVVVDDVVVIVDVAMCLLLFETTSPLCFICCRSLFLQLSRTPRSGIVFPEKERLIQEPR